MIVGSSSEFCLIAEGKADIYPRLAPTMEWDIAAGQAIVEESKGRITKYKTKESIKYNKQNLLNPYFVTTRQ